MKYLKSIPAQTIHSFLVSGDNDGGGGGETYSRNDTPLRIGESFARPSGIAARNNAKPTVIRKHGIVDPYA